MISPSDISRKSEAIYREYARAWLNGAGAYFPRFIPADRSVAPDHGEAIRQVTALREHSKDRVGRGYRVEWEEIRSRRHGVNLFPRRIVIDTEDDLLFLCGKEKAFRRWAAAVERIRADLPAIEPWLSRHMTDLVAAADDLDGLIAVGRYMVDNPRPGIFARELPVPVDTKFVERNERLLRQWLDIVLPSSAIRADEDHFARRFGLRYCEPEIFVRVLDPALQTALGFPFAALSAPLHSLAELKVSGVRIIIVENKVTLLTLPLMERTLALGGLGNGVMLLRYLTWLPNCSIIYWGDLDCDGLGILSRLRTFVPSARSMLMDGSILKRYTHLLSRTQSNRSSIVLGNLTEEETEAFHRCHKENLRLEQERIPSADVAEYMAELKIALTIP